MMTQKEGVYQAIKSVTDFTDGEKIELTREQKSEVRGILIDKFENGEIELKNEQDDIKKYVNGLLNNWLRKDKRLNGNTVYKAKNPGSRTGNTDAQVKNLRLLKKTTNDPTAIAEIDEAIAARLAEIKPEVKVEIDATAIPTHLQHLL